MFNRPLVRAGGQIREGRVGDGTMSHLRVTTNSGAGAQNITIPQILGGVALFTGAAGAVAYTFPTAAAILAACPDMDIGDTISFFLCNTAAQTATFNGAAAGVTFAGFTTVNAATRQCIIEKTSGTTVTVTTI